MMGRRRGAFLAGVGALCALSMIVSPLLSRAAQTVALPVRLTAARASVIGSAFTDGNPYPGPLPLAIPASGGTIQAENFNSGPPEQAFHACTPGDQGNARTYRADPHDIDIYHGLAGQFYVQSSSPHTSASSAHNCPGPAPFFSDYVKYSFTVAVSGWYRFVGAVQNGEFWTRVDDINRGQTPPVGRWGNVLLAPAVHLLAGPTHVLTIEMLGFGADVDAVYVTPITVDFPAPRIVSAPLTTDEVVVADAVVTDPQFGAVPDNAAFNNRLPIQKALNLVSQEGGGTVFLPPGVYTVNGTLSVPANVTLRGDWSSATSKPGQTILAAKVKTGPVGHPFITLAGTDAGVSHLSVWYPLQNFTHPARYPPTIRSLSPAVTVNDVTLYDSDQGVFFRAGGAADINGLRATCFTACIVDDGDLEYAFITNIKISNQFWESAPKAVTNKPVTASNKASIARWTAHHLTAVHLYRNDNLTLYAVAVSGAQHGIVTTRTGCTPACGTYGSFSKISASLDRSGDYVLARTATGVNSIMDTDLVSEARNASYSFAPPRLPARTGLSDLYDVMAAPFSAQADGMTDDTAAIQSALDTAAANGGGTVYMPAGTYLVSTHLTVPAGVELRGSFSARHTSESVDGTTLLAVEGQGTSTPNSDTAFISLSPKSGVRGLTVRYPNQGFGSAVYPVVPFPFTFRSLGPDTSLEDVNVLDGYQIADFSSYRSDGFVIKDLWATAFLSGVNIGGMTNTGWLERSVVSYGDLYQSRHRNSPHAYGRNAVAAFTSAHVVAYYLGSVTALQSLGAMSFTVNAHLVTYKGAATPGPTSSTFFASSSDTAGAAGFVFGAGSRLEFVGLRSTSPHDHTGVSTQASFAGLATVDDAALQGHRGIVKHGGILRVYPENLKIKSR